MRLSFDPERPIYQQIIDEFKRAVARGELKPGDRIPSQRDLALQARVNPNTVQRAYREMEWMGLVETVRGQGTFVSGEPSLLARLRAEMAEEAVRWFVGEMRALGFVPEEILDWVRRGVVAAGDPAEGRTAGVYFASKPPGAAKEGDDADEGGGAGGSRRAAGQDHRRLARRVQAFPPGLRRCGGVSLESPLGQIVGLLGTNGSGKLDGDAEELRSRCGTSVHELMKEVLA